MRCEVSLRPKHALTKEFFDIEAGSIPEPGDPTRDAVLSDMALCRHGLGVSIWLQNAYVQIMRGTGALCKNMAHVVLIPVSKFASEKK